MSDTDELLQIMQQFKRGLFRCHKSDLNVIVHANIQVKDELIWKVITEDISDLKREIEEII